MGIFNEFFKKEKPVFTGLKFGFGSGGGAESSPGVFSASGGNVDGGFDLEPGNGYTYHTFTSSGSFTISGGPKSVEYLIIAGGGGGGGSGPGSAAYGGAGGGAGGLLNSTITLASGTYPITVGPGGGGAGGGGQGTPYYRIQCTRINLNWRRWLADMDLGPHGSDGNDGGSGGGGGAVVLVVEKEQVVLAQLVKEMMVEMVVVPQEIPLTVVVAAAVVPVVTWVSTCDLELW